MHKNKINNKVYIGICSTSVKRRWRDGRGYSDQFFSLAIKKYGWNNFEHLILFENLTRKEAQQKEIELISKNKSTDKTFGYNISIGGNTDKMSETTKEKLRQINTGKVLSDKHKAKISKSHKGIKFSESHIENLSKSHKGNIGFWKGKKRDETTNQKIKEKLAKKILCIETGKIYWGLKEASVDTGYQISRISKWCRGVKPRNCNLTFKYI